MAAKLRTITQQKEEFTFFNISHRSASTVPNQRTIGEEREHQCEAGIADGSPGARHKQLSGAEAGESMQETKSESGISLDIY